jgi:hypothetical protein
MDLLTISTIRLWQIKEHTVSIDRVVLEVVRQGACEEAIENTSLVNAKVIVRRIISECCEVSWCVISSQEAVLLKGKNPDKDSNVVRSTYTSN